MSPAGDCAADLLTREADFSSRQAFAARPGHTQAANDKRRSVLASSQAQNARRSRRHRASNAVSRGSAGGSAARAACAGTGGGSFAAQQSRVPNNRPWDTARLRVTHDQADVGAGLLKVPQHLPAVHETRAYCFKTSLSRLSVTLKAPTALLAAHLQLRDAMLSAETLLREACCTCVPQTQETSLSVWLWTHAPSVTSVVKPIADVVFLAGSESQRRGCVERESSLSTKCASGAIR